MWLPEVVVRPLIYHEIRTAHIEIYAQNFHAQSVLFAQTGILPASTPRY